MFTELPAYPCVVGNNSKVFKLGKGACKISHTVLHIMVQFNKNEGEQAKFAIKYVAHTEI